MKIFGDTYEYAQPTKTGCNLIADGKFETKSSSDIESRLEVVRTQIEELEFEKNYLEGVALSVSLMNITA